jgi:carbon storage regulator
MLIMRRRAGEKFLIGADIEIEILEIGHTRVRIGIKAPDSVAIVRKEVALTRDENLSAALRAPAQAITMLQGRLGVRSAAENSEIEQKSPP